MLKMLQEPGEKTYFVLLTAWRNELLPTILSRTLVVRFGPLAESVVRAIIESKGTASEAAKMAAELSGGSVEAALALADPEATGERRAFVDPALAAPHPPSPRAPSPPSPS